MTPTLPRNGVSGLAGAVHAALREWLRDWAAAHPRRGFRNAYADARGEGQVDRPTEHTEEHLIAQQLNAELVVRNTV